MVGGAPGARRLLRQSGAGAGDFGEPGLEVGVGDRGEVVEIAEVGAFE